MDNGQFLQLGRDFGASASRTRKTARKVVHKVGGQLRNKAVRAAPVRTGFHRGAIHGTPEGDLGYVVSAGAEYAVHLEWGTWKMPPQPILENADHTNAIEQTLYDALDQVMDQVMP